MHGICQTQVNVWAESVNELSQAAYKAYQAAFAFLIKSLQCKKKFFKRIVPDYTDTSEPLIENYTFPSCPAGRIVTEAQGGLVALPTSYAGLRI